MRSLKENNFCLALILARLGRCCRFYLPWLTSWSKTVLRPQVTEYTDYEDYTTNHSKCILDRCVFGYFGYFAVGAWRWRRLDVSLAGGLGTSTWCRVISVVCFWGWCEVCILACWSDEAELVIVVVMDDVPVAHEGVSEHPIINCAVRLEAQSTDSITIRWVADCESVVLRGHLNPITTEVKVEARK